MLYQILPKKDYQFDLENMIMFLKNVGAKREKFSFKNLFKGSFDLQYIIDCDVGGKISFYLNVSNTINPDSIINAVNVWLANKAVIFASDKVLDKYSTVDTLFDFEQLNQKKTSTQKNLANYSNETVFMNIISMMQPYTRITIDYRVTNVSKIEKNNRMFARSTDVELETWIRVHGNSKYSRNDVMNIAQSICSLTANTRKLSIKFKDKFLPIVLSGSEFANLHQLPTLYRKDEDTIKHINYLLPGQVTLKDNEFASGIYVGKNYHPTQTERDVYVPSAQMRKHCFISGSTGSGKSSEEEEQIRNLIKNKLEDINAPGFTFLDPLETSALGVIDMILKFKDDGYNIDELLKRVKYIDFSSENYIFPVTLLNSRTSDPTETLDFFRSLYGDQNTIQVDRMMSSALKSLLQDKQDHNVFDIQEIFNPTDDSYRQELIRRLSKDMYSIDEVKFLKNTKFNQNVADPILNRLDPFKNSPKKRLMFGLPAKYDALKDIRKWMDEGYILLFNLKSLSKFDIKVIIGHLTTQYYLTALQRPDNSKVHYLIVDESHDVQMPIFNKITAKLRKAGLSLTLITQAPEQYDPVYFSELMVNINTIISFKQKESAAGQLQRMIPSQDVYKNDLMALPTFVGYLSTEESGKERSILIKVSPPYRYTNGELVDYNDDKEMEYNLNKNRKFALELMARDFISRSEAEKIVFSKHYQAKEKDELEKELLDQGDQLLNVEDGVKLEKELKEGGNMIWDD